jgi:hypothetical protein
MGQASITVKEKNIFLDFVKNVNIRINITEEKTESLG